jgi:hypothetical protein
MLGYSFIARLPGGQVQAVAPPANKTRGRAAGFDLWPLYRHASEIEEPFGPHFELWRHGVGFRFLSGEAVRAYVPAGKLTR